MRTFLLIFLAAPCFAGGPKYGHTPAKVDDEFKNVYHDLQYPNIINGSARTFSITGKGTVPNGVNSTDAAAYGQVKVIQTVTATNNITANPGASQTYIDSGLTATITPTSTNNKVRVTVFHRLKVSQTSNPSSEVAMKVRIVRGSTSIKETFNALGYTTDNAAFSLYGTYSDSVLDTPATTSATIYKTQVANYQGTGLVSTCTDGDVETIILEEIAP